MMPGTEMQNPTFDTGDRVTRKQISSLDLRNEHSSINNAINTTKDSFFTSFLTMLLRCLLALLVSSLRTTTLRFLFPFSAHQERPKVASTRRSKARFGLIRQMQASPT